MFVQVNTQLTCITREKREAPQIRGIVIRLLLRIKYPNLCIYINNTE